MPALPCEFQPVYNLFIRGEIPFDDMVKRGKEMGVTIAMYDPVNDRNPAYQEGNNDSRAGFTHGLQSVKGKIFQHTLKPAIIKTVETMHKWIVKDWDRDAYVYDDPRLQILDDRISTLIIELFDNENRKLKLMNQGTDILLFILKEDIYWRPRIFELLNKLPHFILTPQEQENIDTFTRGIGAVDQFTMEPVSRFEEPPMEAYPQC